MQKSLVTVASFGDVFEANLARAMLESEGIQAYLADGEVATMAWHLTGAVGGVKLQVPASDEATARALLAAAKSPAAAEDADGWDAAEEFAEESDVHFSSADPPEVVLTAREQSADRALRGALLGILFFPIQFYVWFLLIELAGTDERLAPDKRNRAIIAAIISVPYLIVWLLLLGSFMGD